MAPKNRLEDRLILSDFVYECFGLSFKTIQSLLRDCDGSLSDSGLSGYAETLRHQKGWQLPASALDAYDAHILTALGNINARRAIPLDLKYYQYMALLNTEFLLHQLSADPARLLEELNRYVQKRNRSLKAGTPYPLFEADDLNKLAIWMATGSGKTLLMHLNYYQYLHYWANEPPQNILLITPNEGLSAQHEAELIQSGIPVERWRGPSAAVNPMRDPGTILIIEITKLNATKRGSAGVSASSASFRKPNLLFVDEGHKGSAGEAWKNVRGLLGAGGFTFEYSATFGQAVNAASSSKDGLLDEYSKAIAFDYSYKYFYGDGYGKDYAILNLPAGFDARLSERLLLANLLTFYQQRRAYDANRTGLEPYGIEPPLWVFVGSNVNAVAKSSSGMPRSDVLDVVRFLQHFVSDAAWSIAGIGEILAGKSGLQTDGYDLFAGRFRDLGTATHSATIYATILRTLFHSGASGGLHLVDISQADGEIALRVGTSTIPFGVINIGDTATFLKLAAEPAYGLTIVTDRFGSSLFGAINRADSTVNMLIGSKKFTEGWNSWRVSSMSLLNVGKNEGSQIIQLFGRGVRLRGYGRSLQRSSRASVPAAPALQAPLRQLETLSIFGIKADYMESFKKYLEDEGLDVEPTREITLPVHKTHEAIYDRLPVPTLRGDLNFVQMVRFSLAPDRQLARIKLNLGQEVELLTSVQQEQYGVAVADDDLVLDASYLRLLDWSALLLALVAHKQSRGYTNMKIALGGVRAILADNNLYTIKGGPALLAVKTRADLQRLQTIAHMVIEKYADQYWKQRKLQWEAEHLEYRSVAALPDLIPDPYVVHILAKNEAFIQELEALRDSGELYTHQPDDLPTVFFERHLYQPLLTANGPTVKITPVGLNSSEQTFVEHLRDFVIAHPRLTSDDRELYLLRNLSRGKGIGFFETAGFYPDFILWVLEPERIRIVFIDPKGIRNLSRRFGDEKIGLHMKIKEYEQRLQPDDGRRIQLDSFIDSETHHADLGWMTDGSDGVPRLAIIADFHQQHVLFQEEGLRRLAALFAAIGVKT
ncbi:MAG: DEAD/DEAH box helicase family protein [Herpetosiphonaceae bacterium]|nr:DEAD/DEAH box helicase family protein [Herpetosiphonaceae bacterium]